MLVIMVELVLQQLSKKMVWNLQNKGVPIHWSWFYTPLMTREKQGVISF